MTRARISWTPEERTKVTTQVMALLGKTGKTPNSTNVRWALTHGAQSVLKLGRSREYFAPPEIDLMLSKCKVDVGEIIGAHQPGETPGLLSDAMDKEAAAEADRARLIALWRPFIEQAEAHFNTFGTTVLEDALRWQEHMTRPQVQQITLDINVSASNGVQVTQAAKAPMKALKQPKSKIKIAVAGVHSKHWDQLRREHPGYDITFIDQRSPDRQLKEKASSMDVVVMTKGVNGRVLTILRNVSRNLYEATGMSTMGKAIENVES